MDTQKAQRASTAASDLLVRQTVQSRLLCKSNYPQYLRALWRSTSAFGVYRTALTLFRRARLLRLMLRIVQGVWLALQTGTLVLLLLPIVLVLLPGVLVLSILMLLGGVLELRRLRSVMTARMQGKIVLLLQADVAVFEGEGAAGQFFRGQLRALQDREDVIAVVRSPYVFSSKGLGGKGFYWAQRREARRVYLCRTYGFFALRTIAQRAAREVVFVA